MNYILAAQAMREEVHPHIPVAKRCDSGLHPCHILWMLDEVEKGQMSDGKAGRWLGWAQAVACIHGFLDLETCKKLNRLSSCDEADCPRYGVLHEHGDWDVFQVESEPSNRDSSRYKVRRPDGKYHLVYATDTQDAIDDAQVNYAAGC